MNYAPSMAGGIAGREGRIFPCWLPRPRFWEAIRPVTSTPPGRCGNFSKNTQCLRLTRDNLGALVEFLHFLIVDSQSPGRTGRQPRRRPIILSYLHYQNPPHLTRNAGNLNQLARSDSLPADTTPGCIFSITSPTRHLSNDPR